MSDSNNLDSSHQHRDHYRSTIKSIVTLSVVAVVLMLVLGGLMLTTPQPQYYATTTAGEVVPMHSLSEPVITNDYLLQWSGLAVRTAFNMNFVNNDASLAQAKSDFSSSAWDQFMAAIKSSGLLDTISSKKLQMNAVVSAPPVILSSDVVHGRYTWRIQIPLLVTFTSASQTTQSRWLVTMNVQRISTLDAYKGIQISSFSANHQS
jgi:intracellular multiplication protein IcmL